jgi:hypothetical protein
MSWLNFEIDGYVVVIPESDILPHGHREGEEIDVEIAWMDCPCKPKLAVGDAEGPYAKPMIVHNSFEITA